MLLNNLQPRKSLASIVRFYRIIDFDFSSNTANADRIKAYRPRIEHCIQFTPFDNEQVDYPDKKNISYKVALFGQQTVLSYRKLSGRFLNFQVVLQPGVLHSLLKTSMLELSNNYCDAEVFLGKRVHLVNEQLAACKTYREMTEKVEYFLMSLLRDKNPVLHPVNRIAGLLASSWSHQHMSYFASQANLCYRQFDRAFKANTGIAPKDFRTLVKLDRAYLHKNRDPGKDWLSIALDCGFYDYQHLVKNYQKFTGYSPTEFHLLEQRAPERAFGDFEQ